MEKEERRDRWRDFDLRFDHANEDAIPKIATTTPMRPMTASVDMSLLLVLLLLFASRRKRLGSEYVGVARLVMTSMLDSTIT